MTHYRQQLNMNRACNQPLPKDKHRDLRYKMNQMVVNLEAAKKTNYALVESHIRYGLII